MKLRAALVVTSIAVAGLAGSSHAAPACNLIEDAKNDTFALRNQDTVKAYGPQEDSLDIITGDIAASKTELTATLRVVKMAKTAATAPNGLSFRIQFLTPGTPDDTNLWIDARIDGTGATVFGAGSRAITANLSTKLAEAKGVFDFEKSEVRITAPLDVWSTVAGKIKTGDKITLGGLDQTASRFGAVNPATGAGTAVFADVTTSDKTIAVGAPSCLEVGK